MLAFFSGTIGKLVIIGIIIAAIGGYIWYLRNDDASLAAQLKDVKQQVTDITADANTKIKAANDATTAAAADAEANKEAFDKFKADTATIDKNLQANTAAAAQQATQAATTIEQVNNAPVSKCLDNARLTLACDGLRRQQLGFLGQSNPANH